MFTLTRAFSILLFFTAFFLSCEQELVEVANELPNRIAPQDKFTDVTNTAEPINFCGLAIGQEVRYLRFRGYQYGHPDSEDNYAYLDDTLVLKIIDEDELGFLVEEYYSPGSAVRNGGDATFAFLPDSILYYHIRLNNDTLQIPDPAGSFLTSRVFFSRNFFLGQLSGEAEIIGWQTSFPYHENYREGMVASWELFGQEYINLRLLVDNQAMAVDGPGYTFAYHPTDGLIRSVTYSWWTQEGGGHDLLPGN